LVHQDERQDLKAFIQAEHETTKTFRGITKSGKKIYFKMTHLQLNSSLYGAIVARIINVTQKVTARRRVKYMTNYDPLTDLPNRNYFFKVLKKATKQAGQSAEKFAVLHIHLNHFKQINETFGYE